MSMLTEEIERRLAEAADLSVLVEEDGGRLVLTGLIASEDERSTALDLVAEVAGALEVDDNLRAGVGIPQQTELGGLNAGGMGIFPDADSGLEEESEAI